jgi:hypothetical protein
MTWIRIRNHFDPGPHSPKKLDPNPHKVNVDPKHCLYIVYV